MLVNVTRQTTLAERITLADTFVSRLAGLMGRSQLPNGEGLVISPCSSVHTFFMRFAIDVIFIDREYRVIRTIPAMRPFRFSPYVRSARQVVELPTGTIERSQTRVGDILRW
jgi:uncharacterized membrane protein (UPF0127 family)